MSKNFRPEARSIGFGAACAFACLTLTGAAQAAQPYEEFKARPVQEVVSAGLISGPHYKIAATVQTNGFLNQFVTNSDYGLFAARSDAMMRRLLREIPAITALRQISTSDAYAKAVEQAAMGSVRGVQSLVNDPVQTVANVPNAIFDVFSRVGAAVSTSTSGQNTGYEDSGAAQALQMSSYKREYAKQLGVDPYSSNPVLQKELDSVAWAAAIGNLTVGAATMVAGGPAVAALSAARNLDVAANIITSQPPSELALQDQAAMSRMGIDDAIATDFMGQQQFSPRHKYVLLTSLDAMNGTAGRSSLIEAALEAPTEETALFYQQMAELLDGYNGRIAPIVRLVRYNRLVLAQDQNGRTVIMAPLDYAIWNERAAAALENIAKSMHLKPGGDRVQIWITGIASPRFMSEAKARGVMVKDHVGSVLPLLD